MRWRIVSLASPFAGIFIAGLLSSSCLQKTECVASCDPFFDDVQQLDNQATLRKATMALASRLPAPYEVDTVTRYGQAGLESMLDKIMTEDAFYARVTEMYNDLFLTDGYLGNGTNLLEKEQFGNATYFEKFDNSSPTYLANRVGANEGIAREPLNIITHVIRNDRAFTEILTADYTLVNAYSAQSYGLLDVSFPGDPANRENVQEAKVPGRPNAGLLTTISWLNRFPTSATNRNRHRSRYVYLYFLDIDVLQFGQRPLSTDDISSNSPTMNDPNCTACHQYVDPVASTFANWNDRGAFERRDWYKDMFQAGLKGSTFNNKGDGVQWLGKQIAADPGFVRATVKTVFKGLTGITPLTRPADGTEATPAGKAQLAALEAQLAVLAEAGDRFKANGYNFKTIVKSIVLSPYFRATNASATISDQRAMELDGMAMAHMLTPEQLNRKIVATMGLGHYWGQQNQYDKTYFLTSGDDYLIYYGGIDSYSTTTRITDPNGIMVNIARRMGNDMSCKAVAVDFAARRADRALFANVETSSVPRDAQGKDIAANAYAIRQNIQYLHDRFLQEKLAIDDAEISRTYQLFADTVSEGVAGIADGSISAQLPGECQATQDPWTGDKLARPVTDDPNYTIRGWMAVTAYLLGDYKFLFE